MPFFFLYNPDSTVRRKTTYKIAANTHSAGSTACQPSGSFESKHKTLGTPLGSSIPTPNVSRFKQLCRATALLCGVSPTCPPYTIHVENIMCVQDKASCPSSSPAMVMVPSRAFLFQTLETLHRDIVQQPASRNVLRHPADDHPLAAPTETPNHRSLYYPPCRAELNNEQGFSPL